MTLSRRSRGRLSCWLRGPPWCSPVWEPVATWEPYDPATILSARVSKLLPRALGVDKIAAEVAEEKVKQGVALVD
jgi:hypothetical protein